MKSKKGLLILLGLVIASVFYFFSARNPLLFSSLKVEWIDNNFPEKLDEDTLLPYGYTFGPWPKEFQGNPIVTQLTYQKGPPEKFIQEMTQIWKPVEVELSISGPKTLNSKLNALAWKQCFESTFNCTKEKESFLAFAFPEQKVRKKDQVTLTWFDSLDPLAARGTHLSIKTGTYQVDRYTVITPDGSVQNFSLKAISNPMGDEARALFLKTIGSLKVKDDLSSSRAWIQNKIKSISLKQVEQISDAKLRFGRLIQVQNFIFSLLSVDPTLIAPFFHLAGVTHLLAMEIMKTDKKYFEGQEAWTVSFKPLFETLLKYSRDFPDAKKETSNIESLLQDILYEQNKLSR